MRDVRPLLLQKLDLELPGIRLRRLSVHQHLPEVERLSAHSHAWSQILFYFGGQGLQWAQGEAVPVSSGTVFYMAPRVVHAFEEKSTRRPVCLVIDFEWKSKHPESTYATLPAMEVSHLRMELAALTRLPNPGAPDSALAAGARVLQITDILLRGLGLLRRSENKAVPGFLKAYDRLLLDNTQSRLSLKEMASRLGYHRDALNRRFKSSTGLTLGQYRSSQRALEARKRLAEARQVREVSDAMGFPDPNYFARWFRRQTGQRPSDFLGRHQGVS